MTITQEDLIKEISKDISVKESVVRNVFKSAEKKIQKHLSSTSPENSVTIKPFIGMLLECKYIPEKEIHGYDDILCKPKIWTKAKVTRYYNRQLNN